MGIETQGIEPLHDGKHYDRSNPKYKVVQKINDKKECKYCGCFFHKKGLGSHESRCKKNPNRKIKNKRYGKKDSKKSEQNYLILEKLKELDPKLIELMEVR